MKKKLLLTTALVTLLTMSNVYAVDLNIKAGDTVKNPNTGVMDGTDAVNYDTVTINGGNLVLDNFKICSNSDMNISGGNIEINGDGGLRAHNGTLNITGGTITADGTEIHGGITNISGDAVINVKNYTELGGDSELHIAGGTLNLSKGIAIVSQVDDNPIGNAMLEMTDGVINMEQSYLGSSKVVNDMQRTAGISKLLGGTINVNKGRNIFLMDNPTVGNTINIVKGATLEAYKSYENSESGNIDDIIFFDKTSLNLTDDGAVNLEGKLVSNVNGTGNLNIKSSGAVVDGDVKNVNLNVSADHLLSKAITGTVGDLAALNVNKGTFNLDKKSGTIGSLNVAANAVLNADGAYSYQESEDNDGVLYVGNLKVDENGTIKVVSSDITATNENGNAVEIYGNVDLNGANISAGDDLEHWEAAKPENKQNMLLDGANVTYHTTDDLLSAMGNLNVKNTTLTAKNLSGDYNNEDEYYGGLLTLGDINIENSKLDMEKLYISVGLDDELKGDGNINITDSTVNLKDGLIISRNGDINIKGGQIILEKGKLESSNQVSLNGGSLTLQNGNASISSPKTSVENGGIVDLGVNKLTVDGDIAFNSGSTLKIEVADSGNGLLSANKITGNEGANLALNITKKLNRDETTNVTLFEGAVDNSFAADISNNRYEIVRSQDGKSYNITYVASASDVVEDAGGSANNTSAAEAWDNILTAENLDGTAKDVAETLNDLSQNDAQKYVEALTAVAPEVAPVVQKTSTEVANQVFSAVSTRLSGGSIGNARQGVSSGDGYADGAVWAQGLYNKSKLSNTKKAKGFDSDSAGAAMGIEKYFSHGKIGLGYAYTSTSIDGFMRDTDVDTHTVMLYGEYKPNNWYANVIASYGWSSYSEDKNVSGVKVKADYDVDTIGWQLMTGYEQRLANNAVLTPEAGVRYVHISPDDYKDTAGQSVSVKDSDIVTGVIGAKLAKNYRMINGWTMRPEVRVAATYDLKNDKSTSVVTLANGAAYSVAGTTLNRFGVEVGAGVAFDVTDSAEFSLGYEGKFREDYQDHTGLVNAKYKF